MMDVQDGWSKIIFSLAFGFNSCFSTSSLLDVGISQINLGSTHVFQRVVLLKRINLGSTHVFQRVVLLLPYV